MSSRLPNPAIRGGSVPLIEAMSRCAHLSLGCQMPISVIRVLALASAVATFTLVSTPMGAQALDQKAWEATWERLHRVLPGDTPMESVHALKVIVPATWAKQDVAGLVELQHYAGAIPEETFSIDPSRLKLTLHQQYARFILDVDLPIQRPEERRQFEAALERYERAFDAYRARLKSYLEDWEVRKKDLTERGERITSKARLDFRQDNGGYFAAVQGKLDSASDDVQRFAPLDNHWRQAVRRLRDEIDNARSDLTDVYGYYGGEATLEAIKDDCNENGPGWEVLAFSKSVEATAISSSSWNANGAWGGAFFSVGIGGGASNYEKNISAASENIELRFCNLTYVPLRPRGWFDVSFLQAIDRGEVKLKPGSSSAEYLKNGGKLLGSSGAIPRLVKGAVVARSIRFVATMEENKLFEMRKTSSGGGGLRIGPWNIGGGGGSSEFKRDVSGAAGRYGRSTDTDVPVILAVITEPTK